MSRAYPEDFKVSTGQRPGVIWFAGGGIVLGGFGGTVDFDSDRLIEYRIVWAIIPPPAFPISTATGRSTPGRWTAKARKLGYAVDEGQTDRPFIPRHFSKLPLMARIPFGPGSTRSP
jgi:hypothetical protein